MALLSLAPMAVAWPSFPGLNDNRALGTANRPSQGLHPLLSVSGHLAGWPFLILHPVQGGEVVAPTVTPVDKGWVLRQETTHCKAVF